MGASHWLVFVAIAVGQVSVTSASGGWGVAEPVKVDVLQFMPLRQAATVDEDVEHRDFTHDVRGSQKAASLMNVSALRYEPDFVSLVVREVFCTEDPADKKLVMKILDMATRLASVACENSSGLQPWLGALDELTLAHRFEDGTFRILPDRLTTTLPAADAELVLRAGNLLVEATLPPPKAEAAPGAAPAAESGEALDLGELVESIEKLLQGQLQAFVFNGGELSAACRRRKLPETEYSRS
jgi:hypothetical protein